MQLYWDNGELGFKDGPVKQWVRRNWGDKKSLSTGFAGAKAISLAMGVFVILGLGGMIAAALLSNTHAPVWLITMLALVSLIGWTITAFMWLGQHWNGQMHKVTKHIRTIHHREPNAKLDAIPVQSGVDSLICWGDSAALHAEYMQSIRI